MKKKNHGATFILHALIGVAALILSSLVNVSYIVGSKAAFFKGTNIVSPLLGAFGGVGLSCLILVVSLIKGLSTVGLNPFLYLLYHIPGFCGAVYFAHKSAVIRLFLPLVCMGLFIVHPVGSQAFVYSFYWLIPVAIYFMRSPSFFTQALAATFVMHAVGSVIYLYTLSIPAAVWLGLIPVVLVERLLFASGITFVYYAVLQLQRVKGIAKKARESFVQ
jgi:hypothetical protein